MMGFSPNFWLWQCKWHCGPWLAQTSLLFTFSLPPTARFAQSTLWQWTQTYKVPKLLLTLTTEGEFSRGEFNLFFKVLKLNWGWHAVKKILLCLKQFPCHCWKLFQSIYLCFGAQEKDQRWKQEHPVGTSAISRQNTWPVPSPRWPPPTISAD